jgi:hypothetical protein
MPVIVAPSAPTLEARALNTTLKPVPIWTTTFEPVLIITPPELRQLKLFFRNSSMRGMYRRSLNG